MNSPTTRRDFLQIAAAGAAFAGFAGQPRAAANNRITIGMIGMGRQAFDYNLKSFLKSPDTQVVAVCDVDRWRLDKAVADVETFYAEQKRSGSYKGCTSYKDFRELLARRDIDAVMISTPDHWHVPDGTYGSQGREGYLLRETSDQKHHRGPDAERCGHSS